MKRMILFLCCLLTASLLACAGVLPAYGASAPLRLALQGKETGVVNRSGVPFVSLYACALALGGSGRYETRTRTIAVTVKDQSVSASAGERFIIKNGTKIPGESNFISSNVLYIPLYSLAEAFGMSVVESGGKYRLEKRPSQEASSLPDGDEVLWLARIIFCESRGQPFEGQIAVGTVVMNRVASPDFPNTIYSVIFDRAGGVQFTPAGTGAVWCTPDESALEAARQVLSGRRTNDGILFFVNERTSPSSWMRRSRRFAFKIGDHSFFY